MSKYVITYNPYKNTTIVEKNEIKLPDKSEFCMGC